MDVAHTRLAPTSWLRLPRRTARLRLTALYGGLFLLSGVALVAITYVLFERATEYRTPHLPKVPNAPAIQKLQLPRGFAQALPQLAQVQRRLAQDQYQLSVPVGRAGAGPASKVRLPVPQLVQAQHQLAKDQHQLAQAVHQLADAVHQVAQAGSVQAAQRAADSHQLLVNSGIALAIVAVLALLAGWLVAGRMLRPIRTITRTARRISSTSLHERLALDGPQDELKELGDTLDDLFGRLEAAFEAQRQFVANASHELRAPLTRQRALIQVALADPDANFTSLRTAHERVLASEQQLEQMIDALLTLTRGQAELERREHLDLAALASQALLAREAEARSPRPRRSRNAGDSADRGRSTAGRASDRQPDRQRDPPQHPGRTCRNHNRDPRPTRLHIDRKHRPGRPARTDPASLPTVPTTRRRPHPAHGRTRTGTLDRPGDRRPLTVPRSSHVRNRRADSPSKSHFRR